jgi:hypothetical protein
LLYFASREMLQTLVRCHTSHHQPPTCLPFFFCVCRPVQQPNNQPATCRHISFVPLPQLLRWSKLERQSASNSPQETQGHRTRHKHTHSVVCTGLHRVAKQCNIATTPHSSHNCRRQPATVILTVLGYKLEAKSRFRGGWAELGWLAILVPDGGLAFCRTRQTDAARLSVD